MPTRLGPSELARALGVSRNMVHKYKEAGKIIPGPDGKFDAEQVAIDLKRNLKAKMGGEPRGGDRHESPAAPAVESPVAEAPPGRYVVVEAEPQPHGGWLKREHAVEDEGEPDPTSLAEAQRRKEWAIARRRELEADQLEGTLVNAEDVLKIWDRHIDQIKNRFLLACAKFPACCRPIADKEFRAALEDLSESDPGTE